MNSPSAAIPARSYQEVRAKLLNKEEIALLDVREEDPHAQAHPLFAANFPLSRVELDAYGKLPRRDVAIVTLDDGEGDAQLAASRLLTLGYTDVAVFEGGMRGWQAAGGEVFRDVNVPSKAFGELVEASNHTPSLTAEEVRALIDEKADVVILDARRFDEYQTMSIPTATSCPGAELVLGVAQLAPHPQTRVIVNCAGRTRSIIGTQSLINAGVPNAVSALRNGTIGWKLAGQVLDRGQLRRVGEVSATTTGAWSLKARKVADRAGVARASLGQVRSWQLQRDRTTYCFDTRTPEEYAAGHVSGFRSMPGGQLVQETEMVVPVRGARIVLVDRDGVRANMTASWLAQMAWDVWVLDEADACAFSETGAWQPPLPAIPAHREVSVAELAHWIATPGQVVTIDLAKHVQYVQGHVPGAYYVLRSQISASLASLPLAAHVVVTCPDGLLSRVAAAQAEQVLGRDVQVLAGGTNAWKAALQPMETGESHLASPPIDRYKRPYEGTDSGQQAMQAYLDWEFGLVEQLRKDGTHHFWVLQA